MRYDQYRYLWPPRPEQAQAATLLHTYEREGWWAQAKLNGQCLPLAIGPRIGNIPRQVLARTRHGDVESSKWTPGARIDALAASLPGDGWYVLVGEALYTNGLRDTLYLHDVLVDDGDYLVGVTMADRQERLADLLGWPFVGPFVVGEVSGPWSHAEIMPGIWLARNHLTGFRWLWDHRPFLHVEGLVLKDPNAPLRLCASEKANSAGLAKCRYTTKTLSF